MELEASWAARGSVAGMTSVMILMPPDSVTVVAAIACGQSGAEEPGQAGKLKDRASSHPAGDQHMERVHMSGDTRSTDILLQGCPTPYPAPHTSPPHPGTSFSLGLPSSSSPQPPLAVPSLFEALREVVVGQGRNPAALCSLQEVCSWKSCQAPLAQRGGFANGGERGCVLEVEGEGGSERGFASPRWAPPPRASLQPGERVERLSLGVFQGGDPPAQSWASHLHPQLQMLCLGIISAISYVPAVAES